MTEANLPPLGPQTLMRALASIAIETRLAGIVSTGRGSMEDESWNEVGTSGQPAFGTGWSNAGGSFATVAFRDTAAGFMWLRGVAHAATAPTGSANPIFTLPIAYAPAFEQWMSVPVWTAGGSLGSALLVIDQAGRVYVKGTIGVATLDRVGLDHVAIWPDL